MTQLPWRVAACPVRRLQKYADKLNTYCATWHLELCAHKTQFIYVPIKYHPNRFPPNAPIINGVPIERKNTMTYLGVIFDDKLKYKEHIAAAAAKLAGKTKSLCPLFLGHALSRRNRIKIIKNVIWPGVTYGAASWCSASHALKIKLRRKFSRAAKSILRLPRSTSTALLNQIIGLPLLEEAVSMARGIVIERIQRSAYDLSEVSDNIHMAVMAAGNTYPINIYIKTRIK